MGHFYLDQGVIDMLDKFVCGKLIVWLWANWHSSLVPAGQPAVSTLENQAECVTGERVITIRLATRRSGERRKVGLWRLRFHLRHTGALPRKGFLFFRNHSRYRRIQFVGPARRTATTMRQLREKLSPSTKSKTQSNHPFVYFCLVLIKLTRHLMCFQLEIPLY
jgi:hypothetical protein